jgi:NADH:ubiquinone oxidoreductase subunit F (NADH-binding)
VTLSGALERPGVYEIAHGTPLAELLQSAEPSEPLRGVLVGGYFGTWLPASGLPALRLSAEELRPHGAALGAGVIVALGQSACPVAECSRVADWFSAESAGQCGPCVHGLAAIADTIAALAGGTADRTSWHDLERWLAEIPGRGACQHPDGATRFVASALRVFAEDFRRHAAYGRCDRCDAAPSLPVPAQAVA